MSAISVRLNATASIDAIEVLAVEYDDQDDYIWVKGKFKHALDV